MDVPKHRGSCLHIHFVGAVYHTAIAISIQTLNKAWNVGTNPYTAGVFYSGSFITDEFVQSFNEVAVDQRVAILAEISAKPQVSQLIMHRAPYTSPTLENLSAVYHYYRITAAGVLTGGTTPTQFTAFTDQYVNTSLPPRRLIFTDAELGYHAVFSNTSAQLVAASISVGAVTANDQFVGDYLEMIAADGISIYRITVSTTDVISVTLNRTEPQRAATIRISNGHPFAYDGTNLWLEGLTSIGDMSTSLDQYLGGYAGVCIPQVGTISIQLADQWLAYLIQQSWDTRNIEVKIGLTDQDIGQYRVIMRAKTERAEANLDTLTVVLRDHSILFDRSMQENTYTGTGLGYNGSPDVTGVLKPLCFGFVRHITPVLIDEQLNIYQVHDGPISEIISVHSGGALHTRLGGLVPGQTDLLSWEPTTAELNAAGYREHLASGTFRMAIAPIAPVTVTLWGDVGISLTTGRASEVCRTIISRRVPEATINQNTFDEFQTEQVGAVGIYITDKINVREALNRVIAPLGGIIHVDALGVVSARRLHAREPVAVLGRHNTLQGLSVSYRRPPRPGKIYRIGYAKNWTLLKQSDLLANASSVNVRAFLQREYIYKEMTWYGGTNTRLPNYDSAESIEHPTLLDHSANASQLAAFLAFRDHSLQNLYECTAIGFAFQIQVGDTVLFQDDELGFYNVKTGIVVAIIEKALTPDSEDLTQLLIWA